MVYSLTMIFCATPQPRAALVSLTLIGPRRELLSTSMVTPEMGPRLKSLTCNPLPAFN